MKPIKFVDQHDYGYVVPACSRKELLLHAHALHQALDYKGDGPFPILKLAEKIFYFIYPDYDFLVLSENEMGDNLGLTKPDEHIIQIREDVYESAVAGSGLGRMVVAHESSHLLRHQGIPVAMACRKATREMPAYRSSEWQANAMGGSILMPASKIIDMSIDQIIDQFQVSERAAEVQLRVVRKEAKTWPLPLL